MPYSGCSALLGVNPNYKRSKNKGYVGEMVKKWGRARYYVSWNCS